MGSAYKYKAANAAVSVNNLVAIKTDILNQMNNRTFTLADLGFTDTDTTTYMSSATTVNGGTWGKALTLPFYYSEAVQTVPFTDPKTVPNPHLVYESSTKKYQRSFPTSTKTTGNSTSVYIDLSNFGTSTALQISYNASTGYITAKAGSTTYLNTKASPCIYVDAQAAGGKGGKGAYVYRTILLDWGMAVAGGGGGGSGAFASLSTDLSQSSLSIYKLSNGGVEIYDSESNYRLFLSSGKDGGAGTTRDQDTGDGITSMGIDFKGTGGAGGNGGNVSVLTSMGDTVSTGTNVRRTALGKSYIIVLIL